MFIPQTILEVFETSKKDKSISIEKCLVQYKNITLMIGDMKDCE